MAERADTAIIPALALRPKQAAQALGVSERTLWSWTAAGEIPHVRRGKIVLYIPADLAAWLMAQSTGGGVRR